LILGGRDEVAKGRASSIRWAAVVAGFGVIGFGVIYFVQRHRGASASTCFDFTAASSATVPFGQHIAVTSSPLARSSSPSGYINSRERVMVSQVCEGIGGSDYKITTAGGLEGYVPAQLLVPRSLVPGSKVTVHGRTAIYDDLRSDPQSYSKMWDGGKAVIVEGPATARGGFIGYKIRTLDPPSVMGWIPASALDSVSPMAYYGIRPVGDEGTASESRPIENSPPENNSVSWRIPSWLIWILGVGLMMAIAALLGWGKAPVQRATILFWCMAAFGFGALGYELWQGAYITSSIVLVVMAIALPAARVGGFAGAQAARQTKSEYEEAEYGVPHCLFERTADGFRVSFWRPPAAAVGGTGPFAPIELLIGIGNLIFRGTTKIEVTKEAVIELSRFAAAGLLQRAMHCACLIAVLAGCFS
jgi:hypothetical protein